MANALTVTGFVLIFSLMTQIGVLEALSLEQPGPAVPAPDKVVVTHHADPPQKRITEKDNHAVVCAGERTTVTGTGDRRSIHQAKSPLEAVGKIGPKGSDGAGAQFPDMMFGRADQVKRLIDGGFDVNTRNWYGRTPLMLAAVFCRTEIATFLVEKGADINARDKRGMTALMLAVARCSPELVGILVRNGANVNARALDGSTALMWAVRYTPEPLMAPFMIEAEKKGRILRSPVWPRLMVLGIVPIDAQMPPGYFTAQKERQERWHDERLRRDEQRAEKVLAILIEAGADVNAKNDFGETALILASARKRLVRLLLEKGADVNVADNRGQTALIEAVSSLVPSATDWNRLVREKIQREEARQDHEDARIRRIVAAYRRQHRCLPGHRDEKADHNRQQHRLLPSLLDQTADHKGQRRLLPSLLDEYEYKEETNTDSIYALKKPIGKHRVMSNLEMETSLRSKNISDRVAEKESDKRYRERVNETRAAIVRLLLAKGPDLNAKQKDGDTALVRAARSDNPTVAKLLLNHGAEVNVRGSEGKTPLMWAVRWGDVRMATLLMDKGANLRIRDNCGRTALMWAARLCEGKLLEMLLSKGSDVNSADKNGLTALHLAVPYGSPELIRSLLDKGANVNAKDHDGRTALMHAVGIAQEDRCSSLWDVVSAERLRVVRLLLEKGADPNAKSKTGETALDLAKRSGCKRIVELLSSPEAQE